MKNALNISQNVLWQTIQNPTNSRLLILLKKILLSKAGSKIIYKELRNRVIIQPTAQRKYIAQFENDKLRELNVSPLDAFQLASVMDALPVAWRQSLKTCECTGTLPFNLHDQTQLFLNGKKILLSKAESKIIYKELRNRVIIQPTAQRKYIAQFENDNLNWKKIYSLPFRVTLDTKSREFQYKLLNRCIATNAFLCKNRYFIITSMLFLRRNR